MTNRTGVFFALLVVCLVGVTAFAGVSITPLVTDILLPPGTAHEGTIMLGNAGDAPVVVEARALGFTTFKGVSILLEPDMDRFPYSGRDLLTITPTELVIQPGAIATFYYRIVMPENLYPHGGRYVAAVFRVRPPAEEGEVVVAMQLASLFLLSPGVNTAPSLHVENARVRQDDENPRLIRWTGLISNDGNVHIDDEQMEGFLQITDQDGIIVGQVSFNPRTLLPMNVRRLTVEWLAPDTLLSGTYQLKMTIFIHGYGPVENEPLKYTFISLVELDF